MNAPAAATRTALEQDPYAETARAFDELVRAHQEIALERRPERLFHAQGCKRFLAYHQTRGLTAEELSAEPSATAQDQDTQALPN